MHAKHQGLPIDGRAADDATPRRRRHRTSRSSLAPPRPARSQADRGELTRGGDTVTARRQPVVAGELALRWERQDDMSIIWLSGALDQATVTLLDRELDTRATDTMRLIIDLTALHFIDSPGLDALVGIHWRASKRGDRLSFRHGPHVAQWPVELTRTVRLRSRQTAGAPGLSDENFYFALAMACVDVDHPRSGDRPEAA